MPAIFDTHHPWILMFGILGNIISIIVYFSPMPTFIQICRKKSTLGFQSLPYVLALFSATLWMFYAFLKTDAVLLISINSIGCIIETIYIILFLLYASKDTRKQTAKLVGLINVVVFSAIFLFTMFTMHGAYRAQIVGWICVGVAVCVFAAPLSIVFQVVRTKSVEFMPFGLSFTLTLSAVMWFGYGLLKKDLYVAVPNVLGFILGISQMVLYGIYRPGSKGAKKEVLVMEMQDEKKMGDHHMININNVGSEVHPSRDDEAVLDSSKSTANVIEYEISVTSVDQHHKKVDEEQNNTIIINNSCDKENEKAKSSSNVGSIQDSDERHQLCAQESNGTSIQDSDERHQLCGQELNGKIDNPVLIVCSA